MIQKLKNVLLHAPWLPTTEGSQNTLTHTAAEINKRSLKTGSTIEETFPGRANKTSPNFTSRNILEKSSLA